MTTSDDQSNIIRVHLSNGSSNNVRYNDRTTVSRIMEVMVAQLAGPDGDVSHFGIRLVHEPRQLPTETYWLHRNCTMKTIMEKFTDQKEWRYELRIRFLPSNLREFHRTQKRCFEFFYDQVRNDYLAHVAPKIEEQTSLELGCLEIRRLFKDMQASALDKKANMEFIENDIGLDRFFPTVLIQQNKTKILRRKIQSIFKRFAPLSESDCMFKFLETLAKIARYDIEIFKASLGTAWSNPVEIVVGPEIGLCYVTGSSNGPTKLADFMHVTEIETVTSQRSKSNHAPNKASVVSFKLSGAQDVVHVTCPNSAIADSLAHLVEGYHMLLTQSMYSVWVQREEPQLINTGAKSQCNGGVPSTSSLPRHKSPGKERHHQQQQPPQQHQSMNDEHQQHHPVGPSISSTSTSTTTRQQGLAPPIQAPMAAAELIDEDDFDYATPLNRNYQVNRSNVMLEELLGEGQFGDVYKGSLVLRTEETIPVAIKTCKVESEDAVADSFLEEAYIMQQFDHPHIIRLLGVCLDSPIWLLIELAPLGELRTYLINNKSSLEVSTLLLYCYQLSMALSYLESRKFIHRDIAARNVLVQSQSCVKLSDFGLCRSVSKESFYTASKGKLPIKWMAPESINFRRFTIQSDIWMFAVCMWEIMMLGVKPFGGVRNHDVIHRLEAGERLMMPGMCPPRLYALMCHCWSYEPQQRPTCAYVRDYLQQLLIEERDMCNDDGAGRSGKHITWSAPPMQGVPVFSVTNNAYTPPASKQTPPAPPPKPQRSPMLVVTTCSTDTASTSNTLPRLSPAANSSHSSGHATTSTVSHHSTTDLSESGTTTRRPNGHLPGREQTKVTIETASGKQVLNETRIATTLLKQRQQAEQDRRWLEEEEQRLADALKSSHRQQSADADTLSKSFTDMATSPITTPHDDVQFPEMSDETVQGISWPEYEIPPDMELDREGDVVYSAVLDVVRQVTVLSRQLPDAQPDDYVNSVKNVGESLRRLLSTADATIEPFPDPAAQEVKLAEKVLGSDMQKVVAAMRLALQYNETTLDMEYKRSLLSDGHVLALDCKNFLEAVDSARIRCGFARFKRKIGGNSNNSNGQSPSGHMAENSRHNNQPVTTSVDI